MSTDTIEIRFAAPSDLATLVEFNASMARETEGKELELERLTSGIARVLGDASRGVYRVARLGGRTVGCLLITREWSDWRDGWFWWIQSVYVAPEARRRGVYRALHEHVVQSARAEPGVCGVRLYVDSENRAAQEVYRRVGLARARYEMFERDFVLGD
jgi:ribosomal protein S18 acetylase RimI-like enzyme